MPIASLALLSQGLFACIYSTVLNKCLVACGIKHTIPISTCVEVVRVTSLTYLKIGQPYSQGRYPIPLEPFGFGLAVELEVFTISTTLRPASIYGMDLIREPLQNNIAPNSSIFWFLLKLVSSKKIELSERTLLKQSTR